MNELLIDYEEILKLIRSAEFKVYLKHLNRKYESLRKEVEKPEGNKDYISGKLCGIRAAIELPESIIRDGEIEDQRIQNQENNKE